MRSDAEHRLQIELATALRERDEAKRRHDAQTDQLHETQVDRDTLCAEVKRLRERDDAARAMFTQLRPALADDITFVGAVLRVEMDKWLASGGDRG